MLEWFRRVADRVNDVDRDLVRRSAQLPRSAADPALKTMSNAANRSMLWLAIAAALASRKGVTRRAAFRGVAAIGGASATTNLVAKPLLPRRRPAAQLVPAHRRLSDPPTSSSFPSGHAASAVAFATAVTMESPLIGAAIVPLATAVAYSRVHTGVHWPTDVVFGVAVGAGMAWATKRWWPLRSTEPATMAHQVQQPALPTGEDMLVLVNRDSGDNAADQEKWVSTNWPSARIVHADTDIVSDLETGLDQDVNTVRALGVAGGDGTVAAAASVATRRGLPLAVVSAGTLNHFARDVGVENPAAVLTAVAQGSGGAVDMGTLSIDGGPPRWFLNTASLGGYPDMVQFRQKWSPRWGKWPSGAAALIRVLYESRPLNLELNGTEHRVWVLFIGNGAYAPRGFAPSSRPNLGSGSLDVRYVRADARFSRLRFVLAALTGALHRSHTYVESQHTQLDITVHGPAISVATDGEIGPEGNRFSFTSHGKALNVYRPIP